MISNCNDADVTVDARTVTAMISESCLRTQPDIALKTVKENTCGLPPTRTKPARWILSNIQSHRPVGTQRATEEQLKKRKINTFPCADTSLRCKALRTNQNIKLYERVTFFLSHQQTPPTLCGAEESVRLALTKTQPIRSVALCVPGPRYIFKTFPPHWISCPLV